MFHTEEITNSDDMNSFRQTDEYDMEEDLKAFANAIEKKLSEEDDKRKDDKKRKSTSLDHDQENKIIQAKKVKLVWGGSITRVQDWYQNSSDIFQVLDKLKETEKAVCLGFELDQTTMKCRLCGFIPTEKGNLNSHIKRVHSINFKLKLCKSAREDYFRPNKGFLGRYRGCRKIFIEDSFDLHTCSSEPPNPEQILEQNFEQDEKSGPENLSKLEPTVKKEPSPSQTPALPPLPTNDIFRGATTLTLFIEPASFHRSKMFEHSNKACFSTSLQSSTEFLLGLSCQVHPPQEELSLASCHVAIQPPTKLSTNPALMASYSSHISTRSIRSNKRGWGVREAKVKTLFYTNQAGLTLQCQNQKNAFLEVKSGWHCFCPFLKSLLRCRPSWAS